MRARFLPARFVHVCIAAVVCVSALGAAGQPPRDAGAKADARSLLREAIQVLAANPSGREKRAWADVEKELAATLAEGAPSRGAHDAIARAVSLRSDPHDRFIPPPEPAPAAEKPGAGEASTPAQAAARPRIPTVPEGKALDNGIAYLLLPGCAAPDADGLRRYALAAAKEIHRLSAARPAGWIIDLRLNGGGNVWPMLLGVRSFFGDGPTMTMLNAGKVQARYGVDARSAWIDWGNGPEEQLAWEAGQMPPEIPLNEGPVAVLLGSWTLSSGEAMALCFASRPRTRTFGEKTGGLTTITTSFPLSDGSSLNLAIAAMGDASGAPSPGGVLPMETVTFGDWPEADDPAARAAAAWILKQPNP